MPFFSSLSLPMNSPRNQLRSLNYARAICLAVIRDGKLPRDMYSKQRRRPFTFVPVASASCQGSPGDCATEAFPLFSKLPTASLLLSIAALSSFTESKFALHGKTRRNVIHISRMIHLCSLSRLFIKRGSRLGSKSRISGHAC